MNKITIVGNLTGNPESRIVNTENGAKTVCNFTVAVNRMQRGQKVTDYFRVSCWEKRAENAMKYLAKGRKVAVHGAVTARAYQANDGTPRASLEINMPDDIEYMDGATYGAVGVSQQATTDNGECAPDEAIDGLPF